MTQPALQPTPPKTSWWSRNWTPWFIPLGCLCLLFLVAISVGVPLIAFHFVRSSDVVTMSVARAQEAPVVVEAIGSPLKVGFFVTGSFNISGASGSAEASIPVIGPSGRATLYVTAQRSLGEWHLTQLIIQFKSTGLRLDLLTNDQTPPPDNSPPI